MYQQIIKEIKPHKVQLVCVSKKRSNEEILNIYKEGQTVFGENRIPELVQKQESLPQDIKWHMIGHLQSNKVKYIAPFITLIHSVDNIKLLSEIQKQAKINKRIINILLQCKVAVEDSKHGASLEGLEEIIKLQQLEKMKNVKIVGLMGMASFVQNKDQIRSEFEEIKSIFNYLKSKYYEKEDNFSEISMGMSGDYQIAISEGSTMVRIGSKIFQN